MIVNIGWVSSVTRGMGKFGNPAGSVTRDKVRVPIYPVGNSDRFRIILRDLALGGQRKSSSFT